MSLSSNNNKRLLSTFSRCSEELNYRVSKKKVYAFGGLWNKSMEPIVKTEMFIYQSKANLDMKILFSIITHHIDPEIRQMLINGKYGNDEDSTFHAGP